ncbi:vacuolar transporter chaperone 4 [Neoconidiobolus thromboides FSU 785]|nr:vacuolar transporter chaperone 4 [Neoconidiobolus thromboides FSU 785]
MKFGQQLNNSLYSEWRFYYIDYDGLKRLIRTKDSSQFNEDDEARFVEFLEKDLEKVSAFQSIKTGEINRRIQHCEVLVNGIASNPDASSSEIQNAEDEINRVIPEVNELAKFTRLNYTGFLKIIKKHDKYAGYILKPMFLVRLNSKPFFKENFDALLLKLSKLYAIVRNDVPIMNGQPSHGPQTRICRTVKYWVHPDNVMELKLYVLKNLPVLVYNGKSNQTGKVDPRTSSIYLDNDNFDVYNDRIEKKENSTTYCLTWFGGEDNSEIFVEKKSLREGWMGETHTKQQFRIKEKYVNGFLNDEKVMERAIGKLKDSNELPEDQIEAIEQLSDEIQLAITQRQLKPVLRTFYNRTAFQMPGDSSVRITLDSEVAMIREDNLDKQRRGDNWRRTDLGAKYPFGNLPSSDIVRFPYSILEVKLETSAGGPTPKWVDNLVNSHLVEPVPNFSKYIHGIASLMENRVSLLPFWLPQMDKDIRRAPSPSFKLSSHGTSTRDNSSQSISNDTPSTVSRDGEVRIDMYEPTQSYSTFNKSQAKSNGHSIKAQNNSDERAPLLLNGKHQEQTSSSGLFSNLFSKQSTSVRNQVAQNDRNKVVDKRISIPVRVEPKVFFANERTFLSWLNFALVLGGLALGLLNFGDWVGQISGLIFTIIALLVMVYALFVFQWRAEKIRRREPGPYDDRAGPILLVAVIFIAVLINFWLKFSSLTSP